MDTEILIDDSYEEDILPEARIFEFRIDDIWNSKMEAYEELLSKNKAKANEDLVEAEQKEKTVVQPNDDKSLSNTSRRTRRRNKIPADDLSGDSEKEKETAPEPKFSASAKKRLKKLQMETEREKQRVDEEHRRILSSCDKVQADQMDVQIVDDGLLLEQEIVLKIRYMSKIFKLSVGEKEEFQSIFKKVADLCKLEPTEILLCLGDKNIDLKDTPQSLKIKFLDILDCFPYKSSTSVEDNSNKLLLKIQSNDTRKKTEIFTHELEKLEEVMKKYAELRKMSVNNLVFEFDGEKIEGSETPSDLDMESGSCIDVRVLNFKELPTKGLPFIDIEPVPQRDMLDVCVLD